jgi:HEAT repeat protein
MKRFLKTHLAAMLGCVLPAACLAATGTADIEKAVASLSAYEDGKDFSGLRTIEAMLRTEPSGSPALRDLEQRLAALVAGQATNEGKTEACKILCVIGGEASLAPLAKLLEDEALAEIACLALSHYPASADNVLREALPRAKGRGAIAIANLLGDRRETSAVSALSTFAKESGPVAVDAAAMALGKIGTPEAAAALAEMRAVQPPRPCVLMGSLRCAQRLVITGKSGEADALCEQLLKPDYPLNVRRGAFLQRCRLTHGKPANLILALLKSGPGDLKGAAIAEVASIKDRGELDKVLAAVPGLPLTEQSLLVEALGRMASDWVRPTVLKAATSQEPVLRLAALSALARVGDHSSVPALVSALTKATDPRERSVAPTARL